MTIEKLIGDALLSSYHEGDECRHAGIDYDRANDMLKPLVSDKRYKIKPLASTSYSGIVKYKGIKYHYYLGYNVDTKERDYIDINKQ